MTPDEKKTALGRDWVLAGGGLPLCLLIGAVYFLPQGLHFVRTGNPALLLEENLDETFLAVQVSRAAGEHPGQPDPYRLGSAPDGVSYFEVQPFAPAVLGRLARLLDVPATALLWAGSFVFPACTALLLWGLVRLSGAPRGPLAALAVVLAMLALPPPYWLTQARYTWTAATGGSPSFHLMLPYSRRFQPQFIAVWHYLTVLLSVAAVRARTRRCCWAAAAAAGAGFGISFYSYLYSWSVLLGWFALGGIAVGIWRRERLAPWASAAGIGLAISIPYWRRVLANFAALGASTGLARTHRLAPEDAPELAFELLVAGLCVYALRRGLPNPELLWIPLGMLGAAALGAAQNVATGLYVQPYHYTHYFGRPAVHLALVALLAGAIERRPARGGARRLEQAAWALAGLAFLSAAVIQTHRFRTGAAIAERVREAWPAFEFLRENTPAGSVVHSPDPVLAEAIPLYTNAAPYLSMYMWMSAGPAGQERLLGRIASAHALDGIDAQAFPELVRTRPWSMFLLHRQRRPDAQAESAMRDMERRLIAEFERVRGGAPPADAADLRYLLLPAGRPLEKTGFPKHFRCRAVWAGGGYRVYALQ